MEKDFDGWNIQKKYINGSLRGKFCRRRDVWWCSLGLNVGIEEDGKDKEFKRPVLIIKTFSRSCFVVPLTTSLNKHTFRIPVGLIKNREALAVISQMRIIDTKRLIYKICTLDQDIFEVIRKSIKDML